MSNDLASDRLPPQNLDAERWVIGAVLRDNAIIPHVRGVLVLEDFYSPDNQLMFKAILGLADDGGPVDCVTLPARMIRDESLERIGGAVRILEAAETPSSGLWAHHAGIVKDCSHRRQMIHGAVEMMRLAYDCSSNVGEAVADAQDVLAKIQQDAEVQDEDFESVCQAASDALDPANRGLSWPSGIPWVDGVTGGMFKEHGWMITGQSGHLKTAFALNLTVFGTLAQGGTVCFFRWEETKSAMAYRVTSLLTDTSYTDLTRGAGDFTAEDREYFRRQIVAAGQKYREQLWVYEDLTPAQIEAAVARRQPWLCVYDTLQEAALAIEGKPGENHHLHVSRICRMVTRLRRRYGHVSLLVSQVNSEGEARESKAIKESQEVAIDLEWPFRDDNTKSPDKVIARFRKNRPGGIFPSVVCELSPTTQKFKGSLSKEDSQAFLESLTKK